MHSLYTFSWLALVAIAACGQAEEPADPGDTSTISSALLKTTYSYRRVISAGDTLPGGAPCGMYFSLDGLNSRGDLAFGIDIPSGYARYQSSGRHIKQVALPGDHATGGITLGEGVGFGDVINEAGTQAFVFLVNATFDQSQPSGRHNGVFKAAQHRSGLLPIVIPDATLDPDGHPFRGAFLHPSINNREELAFTGMIETPNGIHLPMQPYGGLGLGVFIADHRGHIKRIVAPGSPAPGGGTYDLVENATLNDWGDLAFGAHVAGEECVDAGIKQADRIFCGESVYLRRHDGHLVSIAHQGAPAPGGGTYRLAFGPLLNNREDLVFVGDLSLPPSVGTQLGLFIHRRGRTMAIARPGDSLPGGGHMSSAGFYVSSYGLNQSGEVVFFAKLDTDNDKDGQPDTGAYSWRDGVLGLVARTGSTIPGLGTVTAVASGNGFSVNNNDLGQVAMPVMTSDGKTHLIIATPR